ncbi:MAG TPA: 3'(2'),5'-bisphosphate nucleotidase CysQ [Terracidiphilus sp.]|jgi:3'(2'), 5'-bisphosphate nucleotidase|nr:3'(2'),5'-bisphosphate nucleotidase CysQ [Terracidiphilus sp.]
MTPSPSAAQLAALLPSVVEIAHRAGEAIMAIYAEPDPPVKYKKDDSPLTQADLASHHIICDGLAALSPRIPVLSEESAEIPYEVRRAWPSFWLVDPLDGTKAFLRRDGEFTVNIALMRNGSPVLGVVYAPAIGKTYFAAEGAGASKAETGAVTSIRAAAIRNPSPRVIVSRSHGGCLEEMRVDLEKIGVDANACQFVSMSSSLKFCLVAEGNADIYLRKGPTMEWDTAAAQCVLEMAGGSISDLEGNRLIYNKPVLLNPGFLASATQLVPSADRIRLRK